MLLVVLLGCLSLAYASSNQSDETAAEDTSGRRIVYASQWYGGEGGEFQKMVSGDRNSIVAKVCVRTGDLVDQITLYFTNGATAGPYGGNGGEYNCFESSCIDSVNLRTGDLVDGIQFHTRRGAPSPWYGGHGGTYYTVYGNGKCLSSLNVRTGDLVDAIQFFWGRGRRRSAAESLIIFDDNGVELNLATQSGMYVFWIVIVLVVINCICLGYYLYNKKGGREARSKKYSKVTTLDTEDEEAMDQMIN